MMIRADNSGISRIFQYFNRTSLNGHFICKSDDLSESDGRQQSPGRVNQCVILCQDILNIVQEKYNCEDNSLLEEKVEKLWKLL